MKQPGVETRFKPGQSGNPNGRPKGSRNLISDIRAQLAELVPAGPGSTLKITRQRKIANALVESAESGDLRAIIALLNLTTKDHDTGDRDDSPMERDDDEA